MSVRGRAHDARRARRATPYIRLARRCGVSCLRVRRLPAPDRPARRAGIRARRRVAAPVSARRCAVAARRRARRARSAPARVARAQRRRSRRARRASGSRAAGLTAVCRCGAGYPERLRELADPPAVLHVAGDARRRSERAGRRSRSSARAAARPTASRSPARSAAAWPRRGVPVVSGMALGVDSAPPTSARSERRGRRRTGPSPCSPAAPTSPIRASRAAPARRSSSPSAAAWSSELPPGFTRRPLVLRRPQPADRRPRRADGRRRGARSARAR